MQKALRISGVVLYLFLLNHDLDVNGINDAGETPLILAVKNAASQAVTLLLDSGAGIETMDNQRKTALLYAAQVSDPSIVRTLIEGGGKCFYDRSERQYRPASGLCGQ